MDIVTVVIADDHVIFRKGLRTVLNEIPFVKVIAEASNGNELIEILKHNQTDVILMDIKMPLMDGIEATKKIVEKFPETYIVALTMHEEIGYFNKMIEAGASGFLLKKTNKDELERAITAVMQGDNYFSEEFVCSLNAKTFNKKAAKVQISEREQQILELICKGMSNIEIGKHLGISQKTVDGHRTRLFEKTGAKNGPNLVMFAIKNGLIK
jgi:DNA-binding NarL/FixJ family response regulator